VGAPQGTRRWISPPSIRHSVPRPAGGSSLATMRAASRSPRSLSEIARALVAPGTIGAPAGRPGRRPGRAREERSLSDPVRNEAIARGPGGGRHVPLLSRHAVHGDPRKTFALPPRLLRVVTNEKVAVDVAVGAAYAGRARSRA